MSIVTVKDKYQVVIPLRVRQQLGITRGDMLEAKVEGGRLTYTPKVLIDRLRAIAPPDPAIAGIREDAKHKGTDKLSMREINAEVAAARRQTRKKK